MKDKFTITIHDVNGVKQYTLKQIVKKYFFYFLTFLLLFIILSTTIIYFLTMEVKELSQKKNELLKQYVKLSKENFALKRSIDEKSSQLKIVSEKLKNIEEMIGLKPQEETENLLNRIQKLSLTSNQIYYLFKNIPNGSPLKSTIITSKFGYRKHPVNGKRDFHPGIDLRAKKGTPIYSTARGIVEYAGKKGAYGKLIIIQHNYGFKTLYGHLSKINVKTGDFIEKGQLIGHSGNTGLINGPHLHYEVRYLQRPLNPINFIRWKPLNYREIFKKERHVQWDSLIKAITINLQSVVQKQQ